MKKITVSLSIFLLFVVSSFSYSQSAYVKLGGGYGLALASERIYNASVMPAYDYKYGSYGEGINFQAGFGYNITPNFALELPISYTMGKKFEYTSGTGIVYNQKEYANSIFIMPSAVVKAPMKEMTLYTRFGMVIGIPSKLYEQTATGTGAPVGTLKWKESGGVALGINGAAGVDFKASKQLGIFVELFGIGMNYAPSTAENTETYSTTGYTIQPTITYNETGNTGTTNTSPKPIYSFSSFGLNVGITYTFGK